MKTIRFFLFCILATVVFSCTTVKVVADYDQRINFNQYATFAFYKPGIDKAEISDLDKKRILRAIEAELIDKGYTKSENPDILISIIAQQKERFNGVNNGPGWNPWWGTGYNNVSTRTEGVLYIDILDNQNRSLVWQGKGTGSLPEDITKKEQRIRSFVSEILSEYPPEMDR